MVKKKRVAAIITEYWDISHADVIITKMLEGFSVDGKNYSSTLEIASMYVDQFPEYDISRQLSRKHGVPMYGSIEEALKCGGETFDLDGILIIGEHGDYPENELRQFLYPRRRLFEGCLNVMLEAGRIVPVYSDKGFAIIKEDIEWIYSMIKQHNIPFMSSSVVPFAPQYPASVPPPKGAPLHKMFGFAYDSVNSSPERYTYHTLEMMQSIAENRACGETGIKSTKTYEGEAAIEKLFSPEWDALYRSVGGFINLTDLDKFPYSLTNPMFFEVRYVDGLLSGILFADHEVWDFASGYQMYEHSEPFCVEFRLQNVKPYSHFGRLVLEIEKFIHTSRPPFPVERSFLTTGALESIMTGLYHKKEIETPYLHVGY
ncbi:hypothetical protein [Paenibacillus eucommiae]|uniref:Uncharacterized protein n=1 Tax=Paenibacillus eucommiae TaxID=1355755 RepID=A0ABS4IM87_9BACL|nr:hypothetical protein [Paenibacillus eucommiae]MBP1988683.1 hypothetical protein [Paenibacillus eucommiae]